MGIGTKGKEGGIGGGELEGKNTNREGINIQNKKTRARSSNFLHRSGLIQKKTLPRQNLLDLQLLQHLLVFFYNANVI